MYTQVHYTYTVSSRLPQTHLVVEVDGLVKEVEALVLELALLGVGVQVDI